MDKETPQLVRQAEQLFFKKRYNDIIKLLPYKLLERYKNAALYAWRAKAHDNLKETYLVFFYANKAIEINPSFPLSYIARGNAWSDKNEYDKAIDDYTIAIAIDDKY